MRRKNMKILIAYATKSGTTEKCAEMLADALRMPQNITLVDANAQDIPSPSEFDAVVLGSSVIRSKISRKIKAYIKEHGEELSAMLFGVFLCCGIPSEFDDYAKEQLPRDLYVSLGVSYFGGELDPKKHKGLDKLIVKSMRREIVEHDFEDGLYKDSLPSLQPEQISAYAERMRKELYK